MKWYDIAKKKLGLKEIPGSKHNPEIVKMYADVGHAWVKDDETAWCAAFVGSTLKESGYPYLKSLTARDYLKYGISLKTPKEGAIAVLWRGKPTGWQGHVGFVSRFNDKSVWLVGGNQNNQVNETKFSIDKVLGYRWPNETQAQKEVTKIVRKTSTKLSLLHKFRVFGAFLASTIASIFTLDTLNIANEIATGLRGFLAENVILITLGGIALTWFVLKWIEGKSVNDYLNGRYTPSKLEKEETDV